MTGPKRSPNDPAASSADALGSWKEIAAYLKRGVRTVRRWEKEEGLPVHRHLHRTVGTVYARREEIEAWRRSRTPREPAGRSTPSAALARPRTRLMLAVLPFEDQSRGPEQTYIGDGLTDEMIARLGRLRPDALGIIARTTVMQYKGARKTIRQIGEELDVDYVLEGAVRQEATRVRITVQLIQVRDQTQIWAGQYERSTSSILELQRDLAAEIGGRIRLALSPRATRLLEPVRRVDPDAYLAWLKGRHFLNRLTADAVRRAVDFFREAVAIDPGFADAHASLAEAYAHSPIWRERPAAEHLPLALGAAHAALALDPDLAEAYTSLGLVDAYYRWDWHAAERNFERALELNPGSVAAGQWYAEYLAEIGRSDAAVSVLERARTHDPLSPSLEASAAFVLWLDRRYDEALERAGRALQLDPHHPMALIRRGAILLALGAFDEAGGAFRAAAASTPELLACVSLLGYACGRAGRTVEAKQQLERLRRDEKTRYVPAFLFANIHLALGDTTEALRRMEEEHDQRGWFMLLLNRSPLYDPLRAHPGFQDLLRRMNFPPPA